MNVNQKGVKGLIRVIDDLQDKGYYVFPAFDDHSPVDLIALSSTGQTFRLQVKYRQKIARQKAERYELTASSVVNGKKVLIDKTLIDGWAVYLEDAGKVVYINKNLLGSKNGMLIDPSKEYGELAEWLKAGVC
jgi:hypothetical protein